MSIASPSCSFASGCCNRHPISCRDTSRLRLVRDASCHSCCTGEHVYTRPGRVGSKFTTQFLHDSDRSQRCAQWGAFHDVLAGALPAHQNKMTVLREPCSRAHSLLGHWHREFPTSHPIQQVKNISGLATYLRANWHLVTKRPWPERDASLHHFIVGWPQSWYVDRCTRVLCFESISTDLPRFCTARQGRSGASHGVAHPRPSHAHHVQRGRRLNSEEGCASIRELYAEDAALHDRFCRIARASDSLNVSVLTQSLHSGAHGANTERRRSSRPAP